MSEDVLDAELLMGAFLIEAEELLASMEQLLVALEAAPGDADLLHEVFRAAHTMKGNAATVGLERTVDVAHLAEDLLDAMREKRNAVTSSAITLLLQSVDAMRRTIADPEATVDAALFDALHHALENDGGAQTASAAEEQGVAHTTARADTLRVDVRKLDHLMNVTGEIAIVRARMNAELALLVEPSRALLDAEEQLERLSTELRDSIMRVRLVPIAPAFRAQTRHVRDLARKSGRLVQLRMEGEDVEVDTAVVERLRDPLTHMLRNAVAHGIESPEMRAAAGKPSVGTIVLRAAHDAGMILIEVADDGGGLNTERIAARGRELGLVDAGTSRDAVHNLIFAPGFSTADNVTHVSGRGVGMDVVHQAVAALRGSIAVDSEPGAGTKFIIRLPLTLSIIDALCVGVGTQTWVVPLDAVVECLDVDDSALSGNGSGVVDIRGTAVPYVRLGTALGVAHAEASRRNLLVVRHRERRVALVLDRLLGRIQAVVKPLGRGFDRLSGIGGATILGNGEVALILDVPRLLGAQRSFQ